LGWLFEPADIALTAGAFAAIMVAFRLVLDAGDEAVFSEPAWFCYERCCSRPMRSPRKVRLTAPRFDLDLAAIEKAIGPRTRLVIVNSPHNPTARIYGRDTLKALAELLERASSRFGQRIFLLSERAVSAPAVRRARLRQSGRALSMDAHFLQLRQGAARAGAAARLPCALALDAGERAAGAAQCDVLRANGARLVLSERCPCSTQSKTSSSCRSTRRRFARRRDRLTATLTAAGFEVLPA